MQRSATVCLLLVLLSVPCSAQQIETKYPNIKQYYFVMLTRGPNSNKIDSLELEKLQAGHMANIHKTAEQGKLQIAGPFGDDGEWRGIFIFDADSEDEVKDLLKNDPAIQAGRLSYEIHPWWSEKGTCLK
jgi:uncharacterized protein YciI